MPKCVLCPLSRKENEFAAKLFYKCLDTSSWVPKRPIKEWGVNMSGAHMTKQRAMASLTMLVSWMIWNERNAWMFPFGALPAQSIRDKSCWESNAFLYPLDFILKKHL